MNNLPKFKLRNKAATTPTAIQLNFYHKGKRFFFGTGESILPTLWDFERERPTKNRHSIRKAAKSNPVVKIQLQNIDTQLNNISSEVIRLFSYWKQQEIQPTNKLFKEHLQKTFKPVSVEVIEVKKKGITDFNEYVQTFIDEITDGRRTADKGKRYAKGTIKNYLSFQVELNEYQKQRHVKLKFEDITLDFYRDYVAYFNDKNYSPNTIGRHVKQLKRIMGESLAQNLHSNLQFKLSDFKAIQVESPAIYLNVKELEKIEAKDVSNNRVLQEAKDVFLVGCYTAQRFSDFSRINSTMIKETGKGNRVIELIQKKTGKKVVIPLSVKLEKILTKYDGKLPKTYEQKLNSRIKDIGKLAGVDSMETIEILKGGLKVEKQIPKYELIKTHTARRTGVTNMYLSGLPLVDIMKVTGHSSLKQLQTYIKVSQEEAADRMASHPYFSGKKRKSPLRVAR